MIFRSTEKFFSRTQSVVKLIVAEETEEEEEEEEGSLFLSEEISHSRVSGASSPPIPSSSIRDAPRDIWIPGRYNARVVRPARARFQINESRDAADTRPMLSANAPAPGSSKRGVLQPPTCLFSADPRPSISPRLVPEWFFETWRRTRSHEGRAKF